VNTDLRPSRFRRRLHEALFTINIAFALIFGVLTFEHSSTKVIKPQGLTRYFLVPCWRLYIVGAYDINQSLHLPVLVEPGREMAALGMMLCVGLLAFLLLRLLAHTSAIHTVLDPVGGLFALALVPALWLHALQATWPDTGGQLPFWKSPPWNIFVLEIALICGFLYLARPRAWILASVLGVHYALWITLMSPYIFWPSLWVPKLFIVIFPASGFAWYLYVLERRRSSRTGRIAPPGAGP
jgi:hypothetical protein